MEDVMKKMIYLLVLMLLLAGCQPSVNTDAEETQVDIVKIEESTSEEVQTTDEEKGPAIQDEKAVLEALNILAVEHVDPSEINAFLMKHISNLGIDSANYALVTYFNEILEYTGRMDGEILSPAYQKLAAETFQGGFQIEKLDTVENQGFVDTVQTLYANGLKLENINGYYTATIDFERLLKSYGNEIGEDIKAYIDLVQQTLKAHIQVKTQDEMNAVAKLIVDHDKYLKAYPNSMVIEDITSKRDWLREVYYLEGTYLTAYSGNDTVKPLESFKDVVQFYPGTEIEGMTQDFMSLWSRVGNRPSRALEAFVKFYDSGIRNTGLLLSEGKTPEGFLYPRFEGIEMGKSIESDIVNQLNAFSTRYISDDMVDWEVVQSYEIVKLDPDKVSIVLYFDLIHPKYPTLSVRDMSGRTYILETGESQNLEALLPTEHESLTHLMADVKMFAVKNDFDAHKIDPSWIAAYETEDALVIYKPGIQTKHNSTALTIPNTRIEEWID